MLAGYLLALAVEIDPENEDAIYDLELLRVDGKEVEGDALNPKANAFAE